MASIRPFALGLLLAPTSFDCTSNGAGSPGASGSCPSIVAATFDQSCVSDFDCVGVGEGNVCESCLNCPIVAINKRALPAYQATIANSGAKVYAGPPCGCVELANPCCHDAQCSVDGCSARVVDADVCAEAGGACIASDALPDAAPTCVRLEYCALPATMIGVCCPAASVAGGGD